MDGRPLDLQWGPNWEDDLAGSQVYARQDPTCALPRKPSDSSTSRRSCSTSPRICEHCINPSCVASCPSGAMYKREEDGIVLVDQDACRSWRFCVSGCPLQEGLLQLGHREGREVHFCYPRIEAGQPTVCSETCVGKIRYLGIVLYDSDRVEEAASVRDEKDLLAAQLSLLLDPDDPDVRRAEPRPADPYGLARRRPAARPSTRSAPVFAWASRSIRVPDAADGLVRAAALAGARVRRRPRG